VPAGCLPADCRGRQASGQLVCELSQPQWQTAAAGQHSAFFFFVCVCVHVCVRVRGRCWPGWRRLEARRGPRGERACKGQCRLLAPTPGTARVSEGASLWIREEGCTVPLQLFSFLPPYSIVHLNAFAPAWVLAVTVKCEWPFSPTSAYLLVLNWKPDFAGVCSGQTAVLPAQSGCPSRGRKAQLQQQNLGLLLHFRNWKGPLKTKQTKRGSVPNLQSKFKRL